MKEFRLLARNEIDREAMGSPERNRPFLKKCEDNVDGNCALPFKAKRQFFFFRKHHGCLALQLPALSKPGAGKGSGTP